MSTENEIKEEQETADSPVETAAVAAEVMPAEEGAAAPEPEAREKVEWPGSDGDGVMHLNFFDVVGLPETVDKETDPTLRIMLALIAEIQEIRTDNQDLKDAIKYMSYQHFLQTKGLSDDSRARPPASMHRLVNN